ncbi:MAG: hypothetical protein N4A46_10175, partial [Schleiferiaceae bacterium]|nr:hypothetical protein [Schleiferiaceae bacterium]
MQFHWKDRAIWRDILALPPQVMLSRLAKRAGFKAKRKKLEVESQSSPLENILERQKLSANLDQQILTFLSEKYLTADGDFLGSGWQNQFVGSSSMGFLGSSPTNDQKFKPYIQWQKDVKSGFFWDIERLSSEQLGIGLNAKGADVKVPWEFARMHQFVKIALSNKEEGPEILKNRLLDDFMSANPVGRGVHWMNAMEVAIRAINLMVSFDLMGNADTKVSAAIQTHIAFVFNHLERKDGLGNNHYLANLVGLLFGLVYYPKWEDLQEKKSYIISEFSAELQKQFYQEGGNFEGSTYYHALSTELAILGTSCLLRLKHKSTKTVGEITYKALHFLKVVAKSNHELPQIGDNDSGRILPLSPYGSWATPE